MRAHPQHRTAEAYGIALQLCAREPREGFWRWAGDFGLRDLRGIRGKRLRQEQMPAEAFDLMYSAMREDGFAPSAWCIRQGLVSRLARTPREASAWLGLKSQCRVSMQYMQRGCVEATGLL